MNPIPCYNVLILSTANTSRSLFAEYLLKAKGRGRFDVRSAGIAPCGFVDPLTTEVLLERYGIDARAARSKSWEEYRCMEFDFIISVSEEARTARMTWRGQPVRAHWGSPHPSALAETPEGRRQAFVDIAGQIAARANLFCSLPDSSLVRGAWDVGAAFPIDPTYTSPDAEYFECVIPELHRR